MTTVRGGEVTPEVSPHLIKLQITANRWTLAIARTRG